jgi:hypothetical protein
MKSLPGEQFPTCVDKPDFRVGDFYWFYEREMGRSTSLAF